MGPEIIIFFIIFGTLFGIAYLFFMTRNRERLALIEKGADANLFAKTKKDRLSPMWRTLALNVAFVVVGIGLGIFIGAMLDTAGVHPDTAYPGSIFTLAGFGLFVGIRQANKFSEKS